MHPQVQHVLEKIEHLSPDRLAEVEDFIDFLHNAIRINVCGGILRALQKPLSPTSGTTTTMPSMTPYSFGDVVLVAFPFTNLQATKKRPAVIISSSAYQ